MIPSFTRAFPAQAAITGRRIVRFSDAAASQQISQGALNTQPLIGVADKLGGAIGDMVDVHMAGLVSVELGGTVTAGQPLTSDAQGRAIAATPAAATTVRIIGFATEPGVVGDVIDAWLSPGLLHQA